MQVQVGLLLFVIIVVPLYTGTAVVQTDRMLQPPRQQSLVAAAGKGGMRPHVCLRSPAGSGRAPCTGGTCTRPTTSGVELPSMPRQQHEWSLGGRGCGGMHQEQGEP